MDFAQSWATASIPSSSALSDLLQQVGYRVVEAPTPRRARARSKTDALDALLAARSSLVMPLTTLRDRRTGDLQSALQGLEGHTGHGTPSGTTEDPHAGHGEDAADPHAAHGDEVADPHAGHSMPAAPEKTPPSPSSHEGH